jgi:hypothetical protein
MLLGSFVNFFAGPQVPRSPKDRAGEALGFAGAEPLQQYRIMNHGTPGLRQCLDVAVAQWLALVVAREA